MLKSYKVLKTNKAGLLWELPPNLAAELNCSDNQTVVIKTGSLSVQVKVLIVRSLDWPKDHMGLSKEVLVMLKMPEGLSLCIKQMKWGEYRLGPVIGLLTFPHVIAKRRVGTYTRYAQRMVQHGLLYVFQPKDIHPQTNSITGYRYRAGHNSWQIGEFPYPDAVIDRTYPNNLGAHAKLEQVIGPHKIFNKKSRINKIEFYTVIKKDPFLRNFIPETRLLLAKSDLEYFLKKYPEIFLKPLDSMKGRGIFCLTKPKGLLCQYMDGSTPITEKINGSDNILKLIGLKGLPNRPYIIQAGVSRIRHQGRPVGFRVLVTKNGGGSWSQPAVFAKTAPPGGFLTNRSRGADYILLRDLFAGIGNKLTSAKKNILELLISLSLETAKALDDEFGPLGKLGIDIIMDSRGKPWLIEANGNPGRVCPDATAEFPAWNEEAYDNPIAYSFYLAGFIKGK